MQSTQQNNLIKAPLNFVEPHARNSVRDYWVVTKRPPFVHPFNMIGESGCIAATFIINQNGHVEAIDITFSYPEKMFDSAATMALVGRRYKATQKNNEFQSVKTSTILLVAMQNEQEDPHCEHLR
jgi:hypothetical protein